MPETDPTARPPAPATDDTTDPASEGPATAGTPPWPHSGPVDRRAITRIHLDSIVFQLVREFDGPAALHVPDSDRDSWPHRLEPDPVPAIRAALDIRAAARVVLDDHLARARGAGVTWAELDAVLGVQEVAAEVGLPPGQAAFNLAATGQVTGHTGVLWLGEDPTVRWTCTGCGQRITDHGPARPHPGDAEAGHGGACVRHGLALATWRTRVGS